MTNIIEGIDCYFTFASSPEQKITEEKIYGDCLEDIGIIIPNGGFAVVDRTIYPRVGDLVVCCQQEGTLGQLLKQVFKLGKDIIVGTRYKDQSRDFTFKAKEIRGVVRYVMNDKRTIIWECERLKGEKICLNTAFEHDEFSAEKDSIHLKVWKNRTDGYMEIATDTTIEHEPLKLCPCCGGIAEIKYRKIYYGIAKGFAVKCKKCGCSSAPVYEGETLTFLKLPQYGYISFKDALHKTVDKWNTRYEVTANA